MDATTKAERYLTATEVLARMRRDDLPTQTGAGGHTAAWADGRRALPLVMRKLVKAGKVDMPVGGSLGLPYTLTEAGKNQNKPVDSWGSWKLVGVPEVFTKHEQALNIRDWHNGRTDGRVAKAFKRNVKAGRASVGVTVVVVRRKPEGVQ